MTAREFTDIYMPLRDSAYRLAMHFLESEQDAEDTVQDLYIKLWRSRDALDSVRNPKAYCLTLTRNLCVDRIRKAGRISGSPVSENVPAQSDSADELISKESLLRVLSAMDSLPASQRNVLKMRVFEDLSYEEMSERTGMNNLTLRVLLSRARSQIKKQI